MICPLCHTDRDPERFLGRETCVYCQRQKPKRVVRAEGRISANSGDMEWYTPPEFIEAGRSVMGTIDLDPASSAVANATVKATKFYTADDDGLRQTWEGNVWMNPPYANRLVEQFTYALRVAHATGRVPQAVALVNNATETAWFQNLLRAASAVCFPKGRIRFVKPGNETGSPLQGQAVMYLGPRVSQFVEIFGTFGIAVDKPSLAPRTAALQVATD